MKRKLKDETDNYAFREYGVTRKQLALVEKAVEKRYQQLKRRGKLITLTPAKLRKMLDEARRS